jgi:hypothetical protein
MKKSNVTNIQKIGGDGVRRGTSRAPSRPINDNNLIGWLIYRPDTEEFLLKHTAGIGYSSAAYVKNPSSAYIFDSERLAKRYSKLIDKKTEVVPLFDFGDKLAVGFS